MIILALVGSVIWSVVATSHATVPDTISRNMLITQAFLSPKNSTEMPAPFTHLVSTNQIECIRSMKFERIAAEAEVNHLYSDSYAYSIKAISSGEHCEKQFRNMVVGMSLGNKAIAESKLSIGEPEDDLNRAIALTGDCHPEGSRFYAMITQKCNASHTVLLRIRSVWSAFSH
jgi:hypothetical protein